jgi:hypothetical protein
MPRNTFKFCRISDDLIKGDIIYRRRNLPPSVQQVANPQRLVSHLDQVFWRLLSYLQYIGLLKFKQAIAGLQKVQEVNSNDEDKNKLENMANVIKKPAPCQHHTPL